MSTIKGHENPYRVGLYNDIFTFLQQKQIVTRAEMIAYTMEKLGKSLEQAVAAVTVVLSPRISSKRGDCRGNTSSQGHLYFLEKIGRHVRAGVRDPQRFRLRWRKTPLEPHNRRVIIEVKAQKVKTVQKTKTTKTAKTSEVVKETKAVDA